MAKNKFKKLTSIKDTEGGDFGNYDEEKGGGTPRGGVWGGKSGRVGWEERDRSGELPSGAHREDQPRTKDGKFTYNSVNGKETKYESRGETVNPLLTEGKNGVYIDDVDKRGKTHSGVKSQFAQKSGALYDKYKDKWFQAGSELITKEGKDYKVKLSKNDIWEIARVSFNIKKDSFEFEDENFSETKKGRHSVAEKQAIKEAKKNKGETFVKSSKGTGIQTKPGSQPGQRLSTGIQFQINPNVIANFRKIQQIRQAAGVAPIQSSFKPAQNSATQLLPGGKGTFAVNSNVLSGLNGIVSQYLASSVPMQNANQSKPKVNLGGLQNLLNKGKPKP
jgi:hypothetical protein